MKRIVQLTVTLRPNAEEIEMDGQLYRDPAELWAAIHRGASAVARNPGRVAESLFLDAEALTAAMRLCIDQGGTVPQKAVRHEIIAKYSTGVEIRRVLSPDAELLQNSTDKSAEELGL